MIIRKAFKFRLKTNAKNDILFSRFAGANRVVWNKAWSTCKHRLENKFKILKYQELSWFLTLWKKSEDFSFLNETPSQTLQQTLKSLDRAIKDGFDKKQPLKQMPTFKKKGKKDSFRFPQGFKIEGNKVFLPKIGWIRFFKSQDIKGTPKNITISRKGEHWFVSIQVEIELENPIHPSRTDIGVDAGVKNFATLSDSTMYAPLNSFKGLETKLAKHQRSLARKKKFSSNWKKQKRRISKLHIKIADARNDYLHKISTEICKNHALICIEDLKVSNMSISAKGNKGKPGKNVKVKAALNKSILDQGWSNFRRMLEYKQGWMGGLVLAVDPKHTSQTCPSCGYVAKENRKTQSNFLCLNCEFKENADIVAAINIKVAGQAMLACGDIEPVAA